MDKRVDKERINFRFNIVTVIVYIIGIILIVRLFNLQIVHGEEYRNQSDTRLTRISKLEATRGDILDRSGEVLATIRNAYSIELYKMNVDTEVLNNSVLELVKILDKNSEKYSDTFPIKINPFEYTIDGDKLTEWKKEFKIPEDATAEEAFYKFKDKYKISQENVEDIRRIIVIRYRITTEGYSNTKSILIARDIKQETLAELSEKNGNFAGVNIIEDAVREYKAGSLASHIIGYTGQISQDEYNKKSDIYDKTDIIGKTGIESVFEEYLKGQDGEKQIDMSVEGTITAEYVTEEAVSGSTVVLTIDSNLQKIAEKELEELINKIAAGGFGEKTDTKCGSVVVLKIDTGEILAMASYPDYEPQKFVGGISATDWNEYINDERKPMLNRAIQSSYPPGSIFKMVTATAGLESGTITINEKINDIGIYHYSKQYNPVCWYYTSYHRGHGYLNVSGAIKNSCNYFFYEIGNRMGIDRLAQYARYFGLGSKTGVELLGESAGIVASKEAKAAISKEAWQGGETLSAAIGQSYNSCTPLQIAKYIATLANKGKVVNPTIVKSVIKADGTEVPRSEIKNFTDKKLGIIGGVDSFEIKEENMKAILDGMHSVTNDVGGTAYSVFKDVNIEVGGKTGSAQAGKKNGQDIVHAWFVGFAPFDNPEIVVVVMVENGLHGGYSAEAVKKIIIEYFGMNTTGVEENVNAIPYVIN